MPTDHQEAAAAANLMIPLGRSGSSSDSPSPPLNPSSAVRDRHHHHHPHRPPTLLRRNNSNSNTLVLRSPATSPLPNAQPPWARQAAATATTATPAPPSPHRTPSSSSLSGLYNGGISGNGSGSNGRGGGGGGGRGGGGGTNATNSSSSFHLSRHRHHRGQKKPLQRRLLAHAAALTVRARRSFLSLAPIQRVLAVAAGVALLVVAVLGLAFSHRILAALGPAARSWRDALGPVLGRLLVALVVCLTGFPPILGYSSAVTLCGIIYGFPGGWPVAAGATVVGSWAAFLASRGFLAPMVERRVGQDPRFRALAHVLRRDGVGVLAMIRFCPLPYSLSNGFLATIPTVRPGTFVLATALSSPKLMVHVFIGSRVALLAESGDQMSTADRLVNFASMAIGGLLGVGVGLYIFRRTMARAAELAIEEGDEDAERVALAASGGVGDEDDDDDDEEDFDDENDGGEIEDGRRSSQGRGRGRGRGGSRRATRMQRHTNRHREYNDLDYEDDDDADEEARLVRAAGGDPDAPAVLMDPDDFSLWDHDTPGEELEEGEGTKGQGGQAERRGAADGWVGGLATSKTGVERK